MSWGGGSAVPAVHSDGMVPRLLLLLLHRCNDVDHAFPVTGDAHLRPAVEVELSDLPTLVLLGKKGGQGSGGSLAVPVGTALPNSHLTLVLVTRRSRTV